jgi:hypothetical protein
MLLRQIAPRRPTEYAMETEWGVAETEQKFVDTILLVGSRVWRGSITRQTCLIDDLSMSSIALLKLIVARTMIFAETHFHGGARGRGFAPVKGVESASPG